MVGIVYPHSLGESAALWRGSIDWQVLCINLLWDSRLLCGEGLSIGRYCVSTFSGTVGCFVERVYRLVSIVYPPSLGQSAALWRGSIDWQVLCIHLLWDSRLLCREGVWFGLVGIVYPPSLGQSAALWRGSIDWQVLCMHLLWDSRLLCGEGLSIGRYCVSTFSRIVGCFVERYVLVVIVYRPSLG